MCAIWCHCVELQAICCQSRGSWDRISVSVRREQCKAKKLLITQVHSQNNVAIYAMTWEIREQSKKNNSCFFLNTPHPVSFVNKPANKSLISFLIHLPTVSVKGDIFQMFRCLGLHVLCMIKTDITLSAPASSDSEGVPVHKIPVL